MAAQARQGCPYKRRSQGTTGRVRGDLQLSPGRVELETLIKRFQRKNSEGRAALRCQ
jgi:hypothetical protein